MIKALAGLFVLFALVGCQDVDPRDGSTSRSELAGRLEAARALEGDGVRHDALAQVARAAAEAGEGDVVL